MTRTVVTQDIGEPERPRRRYLLRIEFPSNYHLFDCVRAMADQPTLMACGPSYSDKFVFQQTGGSWVLTAEVEAAII